LLIESVLLGFMGGILGLALSYIGVRMFSVAVAKLGIPYYMTFSLDSTVFIYLFGTCLASGIIFGLAPALQISRVNVNDVLKEGGRGASGGRRSRYLTSALMIFEIALSMVLMIGGGLMIRSFLKMQNIDLGVKSENLVMARVRLLNTKYPQPTDRSAFAVRLVEKLGSLPGIESFTIASNIPGNGALYRQLKLADRDIADANHRQPDVATVGHVDRSTDVRRRRYS
jgi:putative ABC transport system permease protein